MNNKLQMGQVFQTTLCAIIILILQSCVPVSAVSSPAEIMTSQIPAGYGITRNTDGMVEIFIPAGTFWMGNDTGKSNENPAHEVYLDAYWIDQTEVTNAMYSRCVSAGGCELLASQESYTEAKYYGNPVYDQFPVVFANYYRAEEYCRWAGSSLPTEAQWEKAARGPEGYLWPWGNEFNASYLNANYVVGDTTPVGSYPEGISPYGIYDMAGNVFEWVRDWYSADFYRSQAASIENPAGPSSGQDKILRGGSWLSNMDAVRTTTRKEFAPGAANYDWGFRCARPFTQQDNQIIQAQQIQQSTQPTQMVQNIQIEQNNQSVQTSWQIQIENGPGVLPPYQGMNQFNLQPSISNPTYSSANQQQNISIEQTWPTVTPTPSSRIRNQDGMTEIYIPAGTFTMGTGSGNAGEGPAHEVYLDAYWIDQTEVTNAMYSRCVSAGACQLLGSQQSYTRQKYYGQPEYANYPAIYANAYRADEYCAWIGGSLPTEAQWEKAARGTEGFLWPWGNTFDGRNLNYYYSIGDTTPVGNFPSGASPYGVLDMAGNVYEWVKDWYSETFYSTPNASTQNPTGPVSGNNRILRGGSWLTGFNATRTTARKSFDPGASNYDWGFRCARPAQ
jgi:formylglycine-generating enzyme required for sulfatase activity